MTQVGAWLFVVLLLTVWRVCFPVAALAAYADCGCSGFACSSLPRGDGAHITVSSYVELRENGVAGSTGVPLPLSRWGDRVIRVYSQALVFARLML